MIFFAVLFVMPLFIKFIYQIWKVYFFRLDQNVYYKIHATRGFFKKITLFIKNISQYCTASMKPTANVWGKIKWELHRHTSNFSSDSVWSHLIELSYNCLWNTCSCVCFRRNSSSSITCFIHTKRLICLDFFLFLHTKSAAWSSCSCVWKR